MKIRYKYSLYLSRLMCFDMLVFIVLYNKRIKSSLSCSAVSFLNYKQDFVYYNSLSHMCDSYYEQFFTTAQQYRYTLMCFINIYYKLHETSSGFPSSGGGRLLPDGSTTDVLKYFVSLLTSSAYGHKCWRKTKFGIVIHIKKT